MRRVVATVATVATVVAVALIGVLGACGDTEGEADDAKLHVIATMSVLGDVVSAITGAAADVTVLMPRGVDPHDFQASARQATALRAADLVVANGLGLEAGARHLLEDVEGDGRLLELAPRLDPRPFAAGDGDAGDAGLDPHVWLDPVRMAGAARLVGTALAAIDATVDWEARAEAYARELLALHDEIDGMVATIALERRVLVTNHDVLGYFAHRYGLEVEGVIVRGGGTAGEPSARDLEELARAIEDARVPAIFAETTQPRRLAEALRDETGIDVEVVELYTESIGAPGSGADTYIEMMRTNARRIVTALAG